MQSGQVKPGRPFAFWLVLKDLRPEESWRTHTALRLLEGQAQGLAGKSGGLESPPTKPLTKEQQGQDSAQNFPVRVFVPECTSVIYY